MKKLFTAFLCLLVLSTSSDLSWAIVFRGGVSNPPVNGIGINFPANGGNPGSTKFDAGFPIFQNRIREGSGLEDATQATAATLNAAGWPASGGNGFAFILVGGGTFPSWANGSFSCFFQGAGNEVVSGLNGASITGLSQHASPTYTTFSINVTALNYGFKVTGPAGGNLTADVVNIGCWIPEYNTNAIAIDNPLNSSAYTTEAISHYGTFGWIRWMEYQNVLKNTQTNTSSTMSVYSNSSTSTCSLTGNCTQSIYSSPGNSGLGADGMPIQWAEAFCQAAKTGCWFNIGPILDVNTAGGCNTSTYISQMANNLFAMNPAGTQVYIEVGDEVNVGGGQGGSTWRTAAAAYNATSNMYYMACQLHAIASIFQGVFGSRYANEIHVMWEYIPGSGTSFAYAANNSNGGPGNGFFGYYINTLGGNPATDLWGGGIAPYFNTTWVKNGTYNETAMNSSVGAITTQLSSLATNQPQTSGVEQVAVCLMKYGLRSYDYEAGWQTNGVAAGGEEIHFSVTGTSAGSITWNSTTSVTFNTWVGAGGSGYYIHFSNGQNVTNATITSGGVATWASPTVSGSPSDAYLELVNGGAAIADTSETTRYENYSTTSFNNAISGITFFSGGNNTNAAPGDPQGAGNELVYNAFPISTGNSPRYAAMMASKAPVITRNVITSAGAIVPGGNYLDSTGGSNPTLGVAGGNPPADCPNSLSGQASYTGYNAGVNRTSNVTITFSNSGVTKNFDLEYGSIGNTYTVLNNGGSHYAIPSSATCTTSCTVTVNNVPIKTGWNYFTIELNPSALVTAIVVQQLQFN